MYREYGQVVAVTNRSLTERPFLEQIRRVCEMQSGCVDPAGKDLSEKEYERTGEESDGQSVQNIKVPMYFAYILESRRKTEM